MLRKKRQRKSGNPVFSSTEKIQESLTLGDAAAVLWSTRNVGQSGGLNLKDVVFHLSRGDASLRGVNALHSVPVKASTNSRGKDLQSQLHKVNGRSASGDRIILPRSSVSEFLGIKTVLLSAKQSGILLPSNTA